MKISKIESLIKVIKDAEVSEIAVKTDSSSVVVRKSQVKNAPVAHPVPKPVKASAPAEVKEHHETPGPVIEAPMVGIFHLVDGARETGAGIKKGQVVGIIESMKLMNEVVSGIDGRIEEIYVDDGMPVEYGQVLFRLNGAG